MSNKKWKDKQQIIDIKKDESIHFGLSDILACKNWLKFFSALTLW